MSDVIDVDADPRNADWLKAVTSDQLGTPQEIADSIEVSTGKTGQDAVDEWKTWTSYESLDPDVRAEVESILLQEAP